MDPHATVNAVKERRHPDAYPRMIDGRTTSCVPVGLVREERSEIRKTGKCEAYVEREGQRRLIRDASNSREWAQRAPAFLLVDRGCLSFDIGGLRRCRAGQTEEGKAKGGELTKEMRATRVGDGTPNDPAQEKGCYHGT